MPDVYVFAITGDTVNIAVPPAGISDEELRRGAALFAERVGVSVAMIAWRGSPEYDFIARQIRISNN